MIAPLALLLLLGTPQVSSADPVRRPLPEVRAERLEPGARPVIDGVLDEAVWAAADVATDFVQFTPSPGQPGTQRTEALILYDEDAVYIGFRNYDTNPEGILRQLARRDQHTVADRVTVGIDSYGDGRTAFVFAVNAAGVKQDFLLYNDTQEDNSWDAVWEVAVGELPEGGWSAEFRIPLSQLRFASTEGPQPWRVQFHRNIARHQEDVFWAPVLPEVSGMVSRFGLVGGVEGLRPPRRLEIQPYAASTLTRAPGDDANPFYDANALGASVGADVRYGVTSNLTLSATINPDFGQVEADPATVNLSAFETFFEERRPFFVEGVDVFEFGRTLGYTAAYRPNFFYSRRIGRSPQRHLVGPAYAYVDRPDQTAIAGAAKVSGKVGPWSVGLLDAVTRQESARFVGPDGVAGTAPVEPLTNYLVGRVKRDFREGGSVVGLLATATNRSLSDPSFSSMMAEGAYVGGVDFEHRWANRAWSVSGVLAGSLVSGSPAFIERLQRAPQRYFQRPDASHLTLDPTRSSLVGGFTELSIARTGGKLRGSATLNAITPGFDVNDVGFQGRADGYALTGIVLYNENEPRWRALRSWGGNVNGAAGTNGGGDVTVGQVAGNVFFNLRNFWGGGMWVGATPFAVADDRLTRGGPLGERTPDVGTELWAFSDNRKPVSGRVWTFLRRDLHYDEMTSRNAGLTITVRPTTSFDLSLGPTYNGGVNPTQYVTALNAPEAAATFGRRYVFARLEQETFSVSTRANWTFTPTLSLQLYARPFITSGRYTGFKELAQPRTSDFTVFGQDRGAVSPADGGYFIDPGDGGAGFSLNNPDFTFRSLRANAVVRWEYRPGSALFLVWQQQRAGSSAAGDLDPWRDMGAIFRDDVHNVFLLKLSYWLGT